VSALLPPPRNAKRGPAASSRPALRPRSSHRGRVGSMGAAYPMVVEMKLGRRHENDAFAHPDPSIESSRWRTPDKQGRFVCGALHGVIASK
jgi:hypothetical protein